MRSGSLSVTVVALAVAGVTAACSSKLETGYQPRRLGASAAERRAFYARPFTPEARAAEQERMEDMRQRRPGMGG